MKFLAILLVFGVFALSRTQPVTEFGDEDLTDVLEAKVEDNQMWRIPQIDGSLEWLTEQEAKDRTLKTELISRVKWLRSHFKNKRRKVRFFLYTQRNPTKWQEIDMDRPETLQRSNFNSSHPTRIFAHGWLGGVHAPQTIEIVDSHLGNGRKENYNMIIVDWSVWSMTVNYYLARLRTRKAGAKTAELIDWLHENTGMPFETLHLYGHSLGAHVAGFTGKQGYDNNFHSLKCETFQAMKKRECFIYDEDIRMGDPENYKKAKGVYYLETHPYSPFGKGDGYIRDFLGY
uniref:Lipase domain-containing protein n=1 Tax=Megaselia scalaris TaxID=36166 RepID=T1GG43_MEGSC